jgi:hypothetical protein
MCRRAKPEGNAGLALGWVGKVTMDRRETFRLHHLRPLMCSVWTIDAGPMDLQRTWLPSQSSTCMYFAVGPLSLLLSFLNYQTWCTWKKSPVMVFSPGPSTVSIWGSKLFWLHEGLSGMSRVFPTHSDPVTGSQGEVQHTAGKKVSPAGPSTCVPFCEYCGKHSYRQPPPHSGGPSPPRGWSSNLLCHARHTGPCCWAMPVTPEVH